MTPSLCIIVHNECVLGADAKDDTFSVKYKLPIFLIDRCASLQCSNAYGIQRRQDDPRCQIGGRGGRKTKEEQGRGGHLLPTLFENTIHDSLLIAQKVIRNKS